MNENAFSSEAPAAIRTARRIRATRMPVVSARDRCEIGTANAPMMITNTNRLSTERLFSTR